jgi:hypothetical protein
MGAPLLYVFASSTWWECSFMLIQVMDAPAGPDQSENYARKVAGNVPGPEALSKPARVSMQNMNQLKVNIKRHCILSVHHPWMWVGIVFNKKINPLCLLHIFKSISYSVYHRNDFWSPSCVSLSVSHVSSPDEDVRCDKFLVVMTILGYGPVGGGRIPMPKSWRRNEGVSKGPADIYDAYL